MHKSQINTVNLLQHSGERVVMRSDFLNLHNDFEFLEENLHQDEIEKNQFFYHTDHLGSSSWITDANGIANQHYQYLPFGEDYVTQTPTGAAVRYTFSAKEKDTETGYSYFGARYYDSDLSVWLSVDPLADKYPSMTSYMYTAGNPVMLVDPDGREFDDPKDEQRARDSQEEARTRVTELNTTVKDLESRDNLTDEENKTLADSKDQVKVLADHIAHLEDMITTKDWKYAYKKVGDKSKTETYFEKGVVIMEYRENSSNAQAHEEAHGYQYISSDLRVVNGYDDNSSYDIGDEAQAYKVQVSYVSSARQKTFYDAVNLPSVKGVNDITGDNLSKSKFMRANYPAFIFDNYKK